MSDLTALRLALAAANDEFGVPAGARDWVRQSYGSFPPDELEQARDRTRRVAQLLAALPQPVVFPAPTVDWVAARCAHALRRGDGGGYLRGIRGDGGHFCTRCDAFGAVGAALDHGLALRAGGARVFVGQPYWGGGYRRGWDALDVYLRDELDGAVSALWLRDAASWWAPPDTSLVLIANAGELPPIAAGLRSAGLLDGGGGA